MGIKNKKSFKSQKLLSVFNPRLVHVVIYLFIYLIYFLLCIIFLDIFSSIALDIV